MGRGLGVRIRSVGGIEGRMGERDWRRVVSVWRLRSWGGRRRMVVSAVRVDQGHLEVWPEERRGL